MEEVKLSWTLERQVSNRYVAYEVEVRAELEEGGGDGWNEPRYESSANCYSVIVREVSIERGEDYLVLANGFVGPMEQGIIRPGCEIECSEKEAKAIEEYALHHSMC